MPLYHYADFDPSDPMGHGAGTVNWTGGNNINDIAPEDQTGWVFVVGTNSASSTLEPGYDEVWDGKVEPQNPIVGTDNLTWDALKAMF